jgi:hypothetical protein
MVVKFGKSHSLPSAFFWLIYCGICFLFCRARAEQKIFQKLQAMVPNLLDRVVESEAALAVIAICGIGSRQYFTSDRDDVF